MNSRVGRVADVIQREVASILQKKEFEHPKLGFVTVSTVEVSSDLSYAKIYITTFNPEDVIPSLEVLNKGAGFFRTALSKKMNLRQVPKLRFVFDESISRGDRIQSLFEKIKPDLTDSNEA